MIKTPRSTKEHKERSPKSITTAIITMSDSRTLETDESGRAIRDFLESDGLKVAQHVICKDEPLELDQELDNALAAKVDAIIINGGSGVSPRDVTIEVVSPRLEKTMEGFGELFRMISYQEIGSSAMLSRATAGVCNGVAIFCLPGSPDAVKLAMNRLILPEIRHIVGMIRYAHTRG